jgi:hypothetical protein
MLKLDRDKYFRILKAEGINAALTALHKDKELCEFETFEGSEGYQRAMWDYLAEVRQLSRELWNESVAIAARTPEGRGNANGP